jgi:hypothetical protein
VAASPQVFFLWAPIHWRDRCTHLGVFEDELGRAWHQDGSIVPAYDSSGDIPGVMDPAAEIMASVEQRIEYVPGTRRAAAAEIALVERSGARHEIARACMGTEQGVGVLEQICFGPHATSGFEAFLDPA